MLTDGQRTDEGCLAIRYSGLDSRSLKGTVKKLSVASWAFDAYNETEHVERQNENLYQITPVSHSSDIALNIHDI